MLKHQMIEEKNHLATLISKLNIQLDQLPEGTFHIIRNGRYTKWVSYRNGKRISLRKSDRALASRLAAKTFYRHLIQQAEQELSAIDAYLRNCGNLNIHEFLDSHEEIRQLISDSIPASLHPADAAPLQDRIREWMSAPYPHNPIVYKGTLYKTLKGDLVKSAAEQAIADALFLAGIPYRYECGLSFNNGRSMYYPDFVILHPRTGEIFLWEHFGMSELTYYCKRNADKMYTYFENGYVPGKNLICTAETDTLRLTAAQISKQIEYYFGDAIPQ